VRKKAVIYELKMVTMRLSLKEYNSHSSRALMSFFLHFDISARQKIHSLGDVESAVYVNKPGCHSISTTHLHKYTLTHNNNTRARVYISIF
jgi:hypothetical protein